MAVKNFSSRVQICGRSAGCHGGHNAVEQSAYISRETMYCEYDGKTYYPKYSEDLVHTEVLLPENAPNEYSGPCDTSVRTFGNRNSGILETMISGQETPHYSNGN